MSPRSRLLDEQTRFDWLRLLRTEGIGPRTFFRLFAKYGSARAVLDALPAISARSGRPIVPPPVDEIRRECDAAERMGVQFVARGEAGYPPALRAADSAPPLLAIRGQMAALEMPCVAIVGSRNASASGMRFAETLASGIGGEGYAIVSGLARGVDASAHSASLLTGTIAVLAGGHDRIYPREHGKLLEAILERGAVVSEMPMGWTPRGRDFPRRNRIISGMSLGVVIVEAALRSGSLITARFAAEQGREVFAVPGSPLDPRAAGANMLLRDGAAMCCSPQDVIEALAPLRGGPSGFGFFAGELLDAPRDVEEPLWDELDADFWPDVAVSSGTLAADTAPLAWAFEEPQAPRRYQEPLDESAHDSGVATEPVVRVARLLGVAPLAIDDLVRLSGLSVQQVSVALVELDLMGRLERHGAQAVSLNARVMRTG